MNDATASYAQFQQEGELTSSGDRGEVAAI
jgi:hypothetical protein